MHLFSSLLKKCAQLTKRRLMNCGKIVWMDCEMTGLDVERCRVIELSMVVTDENLSIISPDFSIVIKQHDEVLNNMDEWCMKNLQELAAASRNSNITELKAEEMMIDYLNKYVESDTSPLAGNTIYMDRIFLRKYFPKVDKYLHYRIIDVSTIKELCGRYNRKVYNGAPVKLLKHRALDDIKESIAELKYYKEKFFVQDPDPDKQ